MKFRNASHLDDIRWMKRALVLARKGCAGVRPNPKVGAMVVKDGLLLGSGYHRATGGPHAEVSALEMAGADANGATLYVTLEPCNHHGRTPPCTEAVIQSGIRRVVVAMRDPNQAVKGGGIKSLRAAGLHVDEGVGEEIARELNASWCAWLESGTPYFWLLLPLSIDGKSVGGDRFPLSAPALAQARRMLSHADCVVVDTAFINKESEALFAGTHLLVLYVSDTTDRKKLEEVLATLMLLRPRGKTICLHGGRNLITEKDPISFPAIDFSFPSLSSLGPLFTAQKTQAACILGSPELAGEALRTRACNKLIVYRVPSFSREGAVDILGSSSFDAAAELGLYASRKVGSDAFSSYYVGESARSE